MYFFVKKIVLKITISSFYVKSSCYCSAYGRLRATCAQTELGSCFVR